MPGDCFQLLELPRQPWLDAEQVRAQFQRLAAAAHPDGGAGDNDRFVALNQAWQTLQSPTARLRHYLELAHPDALQPAGGTPAANPDLFMAIAEAQQRAASVAARVAEAQSPLARAILEPERLAARARLEELAATVGAESARIHEQVRANGQSPAVLSSALSQLVFLEKWSNQLRERLLALA